jgi:hypothetical protein
LLQAQTEKAQVENDIEGLRARKNALVDRQGRKKSFSSKKDRNAFLQGLARRCFTDFWKDCPVCPLGSRVLFCLL